MLRDLRPHGHQAPATIVLPGESLSKYGGAPAGEISVSARIGCSAAPESYVKAFYADRCADCMGWQRIVAGRIDLAASRTSAGGRARFAQRKRACGRS